MARGGRLPPGFEPLEPFVDPWAIEDAALRAHRRGAATPEARAGFYAVASGLAAAALAELDRKPLADLDARERRLMNMMLSLCHVALSVELQGASEPAHARARDQMPITRTSAGPVGSG